MKSISATLCVILLAAAASAAPAPDKVLVQVNGVPIRRSEVIDRVLQRYGAQALDEMIDETLLRQAAKDYGVKPDEKEVERRLDKLQAQFGSRALFLSQLEQAGSSVSKLKEQLADEVVRERLVIKAEKLSVDDADLKKAFEKNKDSLATPEAVHLRHILVKTKDEADGLVQQIKDGADFGTLAREHSLAASGKAAGGDYGFVGRGMLPDEIESIAFAMKPGEVREVSGPRGVHILQVLARRKPEPAVYSKVKDDLREMLMSQKIKAAAPQFLDGLRKKAKIQMLGGGFDAVAP
jgi:foldase protein PrsA